MTTTPTSPLIGKICQYKSEHYGKIIFTDWDASCPPYINPTTGQATPSTYHVFSYVLRPSTLTTPATATLGPGIPAATYVPTTFSGSFTIPAPKPVLTEQRTGKDNHKAPWKYGMPWTIWDKVPAEDQPTTLYRLGHGMVVGEPAPRAKFILTPVETLGFNVKMKTTKAVIASCEDLRCLLVNPKDDDCQSVPTVVWVKPDWIELHTGDDTYDTDLVKVLLGKLRAK